MHQTKKGNQWHFGMKAHIGADADSGLVHTVIGTAANVSDVTQATALLHGEETDVFADAGYQGVAKREEAKDLLVNWHVALRPGKRRALDKSRASQRFIDQLETLKASIRPKVEHPFRVVKQQFGFAKVRYRGLAKNTARLTMLFAMSNLWMVRKVISQAAMRPSMGSVHPQSGPEPAQRGKRLRMSLKATIRTQALSHGEITRLYHSGRAPEAGLCRPYQKVVDH
jgi:IS5 family transposase